MANISESGTFTHHYNEDLRPQFHFTAQSGWLNDPNGLVYYRGEYHLFFQYNPYGTAWGHMHWGHAVSRDLVHWKQLPAVLAPDELGEMYSGSAVIDWHNTAGFGKEALIAIYTAEGKRIGPDVATVQCIAISTDGGRTLTKYAGNPILDEIAPGNRDPKVSWHTPTERWIMALYMPEEGRDTVQFFASRDLKSWTYLSQIDGFYECPDFFELDGQWVLFGADGRYVLGDFDGTTFHIISGKHTDDFGANVYAAQTWSDIPVDDGRRLIIAWMRGGQFPHMPFNQQMTVPSELSIRRGRLHKWPVRELETLRIFTHNSLDTLDASRLLLDIEATIEPRDAIDCGFRIGMTDVHYVAGDQQLFVGLHGAPVPMEEGGLRLRILIDRTSIEVFAHDGLVVFTSSIPFQSNRPVRFYSHAGDARLHDLRVHELKSIWR